MRTRPLAAAALLTLAMAFATACAPHGSPAADGQATVTVVQTPSGAPGTPPPPPPPPPALPEFPDSAPEYAVAVIEAWAGDDPDWLDALTSEAVSYEIFDINASPYDTWLLDGCDGAAGSSYCNFVNPDDGDVITLRISNALVGQAHAAVGVSLDKTQFPNEVIEYLKVYVAAWKSGNEARMAVLASPAIAGSAGSPPVDETYPAPLCCPGGNVAATVKWSCKIAKFTVDNAKLGGPGAIIGYEPPKLCLTN